MLALAHGWWQFERRLLPPGYAQRWLAEVEVSGVPQQQGDEQRFTARLRDARGEGPWRAAQLTWPRAPSPAPLAGERWRLLVSVRAPPASANPGRADHRLALLRSGMHVAGTVVSSPLNQRLATAGPSLDGLRARLAAALRERVAERDAAALAVALAVGVTDDVSPAQWRVFNATGITHLVAISGLHVTLFALLAMALARRLWWWSPALHRYRRDSFAALLGVAAAGAYALLAGFSVPTRRTLLMLAAWQLLRALARPAAAAPALAVAAVLVLGFDPAALVSAGFWLSFVAVAILMYATPQGPRGLLGWRELWNAQWRVAVGLTPVTVAVFGSVSVAGLWVNFLAIPLFSLLLVPLALAATATVLWLPAVADPLLQLFAWLHGGIWPWLFQVADSDLSLWRTQAPSWWCLLAAPAAALWLWPAGWPQRLSAALALLPALFVARAALPAGECEITTLDMGQGTAVIVRTAGHTLLYDNGEAWRSNGARTAGTVLPALRALGVRAIDRVVLPRVDADRSAGLVALAAELPVREYWATGAELPPEFRACAEGAGWRWDEVSFRWLGAACALEVRAAGTAALLAGELSREQQDALVAEGLGRYDWVLLPRHGFATGDSPALRAAVGARVAVLTQSSSGARAATVQRTADAWRAAGARVLLTGETGAVHARLGRSGLSATTERAGPACTSVSCAQP